MTRKALVIEDNRDMADLLRLHLRDLACEADVAHDGAAGLARAEAEAYDLIVLDLMLPGVDGLEICRRLRAADNPAAILMLTAKSTELDRVLGLELGADDYLTKPFSIREFVARAKALFRRMERLTAPTPEPGTAIEAGGLSVDPERRTVTVDGEPVSLTAREFDLLLHFACHPGRVFTRTQLLDSVWGYGHDGYEHTVNSHINRLRAKIERDPAKPRYVLTVWGVGYKFADGSGGE